MFHHLIEFFTPGGGQSFSGGQDRLQLAVAALLVQAATMDDSFDPPERATIARLLRARFALDAGQVEALLTAAERAADRSSQIYAFTRIAVERLNGEERVGLIEMLWEVAYADGVLHPDEDALVRRIAGLIYVSDHDRGEARRRVRARRFGTGHDNRPDEG